ncbi:ABC transporter permease [Frigidibacter sp. MR17.24]|uniref:ABC transporter permease n=1 Tax=Frigidibacter sp. MR17.24 TaxID=3127345 RepID=UPI0030130944
MWTRSLPSPKVEIARAASVGLSLASALTIFALWCLRACGGITPPDFLATPGEEVVAALKRIAALSLFENIWASLVVILSGVVPASIRAVPLGIPMGSVTAVEAVIGPVTGFVHHIPVSALTPLPILWIGIGIERKIMVIFLGTFFQQPILIAGVPARATTP